jgi:hypothetical protein
LRIIKGSDGTRIEIFIDDLKDEQAKALMKVLGIEKPEDGNCDVLPVTTIEVEAGA